jgi:hypothetical protein
MKENVLICAKPKIYNMLLLSFLKIVIPMSKLERLLVDMAVLFFPFSFLVVVLMEIDARGIAGEIHCLDGFNVLLDSW